MSRLQTAQAMNGAGSASQHTLIPGFRFLHEPAVRSNAVHHLDGNDEVVRSLVDRLLHSSGGAFLVTGFRGVGKTSVVDQTVADLASVDGDDRVAFIVRLNLARPLEPSAVLVAAIRRLFEVVNETGELLNLEEPVRDALVLAYLRTALQISRTDSHQVERGLTASVNLAALPGASLLPKLDLTAKGVRATATQASFLAYSDYDIEHDFLRILKLLTTSTVATSTSRRRRKRRKPLRRARVVVIFDELDKLTATDEGHAVLEGILGGLKNVLGSAHAHFIFVAGPDVYDRARADADRGTGLYESVFSWTGYVGCQWEATRSLLDAILVEPAQVESHDVALIQHASRGIPRRLVQEVGNRVTWSGHTPTMTIPENLADLGRVIEEFVAVIDEHRRNVLSVVSERIEFDRRSLGAYIAADWILRSGGRVFGVADIVDEDRSGFASDPALRLRAVDVAALVDALVVAGLLESSDLEGAYSTRVGVGPAVAHTYHLTDAVTHQLKGYGGAMLPAQAIGRTRPSAAFPPPSTYAPVAPEPFGRATVSRSSLARLSPQSSPDAFDLSGPAINVDQLRAVRMQVGSEVDSGRYRLADRIGSGSAGTVYRAEDNLTGEIVAVKLLEALSLRSDPETRARFEREAALALSLRHPQIVRTLGVLDEPDGRVGLVMDFVGGESLASIEKPVSPTTAATWGLDLLDALDYLHKRHIARIDLKPGNIIITPRGPVVVDLGTAKGPVQQDLAYHSMPGELIGTPAYLSPEQIDGSLVDIRSDLYSLGLILVELLDGELPYDTSSALAAISAISSGQVKPPLASASDGMRDVVLKSIRRDPEDRFADPQEMAAALQQTIEGRTRGVETH